MRRYILIFAALIIFPLGACLAPPRTKISNWKQRAETALPTGSTKAEILSFLEKHRPRSTYFQNTRAIAAGVKFWAFPFDHSLVITFYLNAEDQLLVVVYNVDVTAL
jgi:hypothetical protein